MRKHRLHTSIAKMIQPMINRIPKAVRTAGELHRNWGHWAGSAIAAHSLPSFFDGKTGVLTIICDSPEWTTALTMNAGALLENLPQRYGVQNIRTVYKKNWKVPPKESPSPPPPLPELSTETLLHIRRKVKAQNLSPDTAHAAEEFLILCARRKLLDA